MTHTDKPILFVDQKRKTICICHSTLNMLGNPKYIQIMVHREHGILAVRRCNKKDIGAININNTKNNNCELYSSNLEKIFYNICSKWEQHLSYIIYGELKSGDEIACFIMQNFIKYERSDIIGQKE